jgi:hypothetical protein
LTNSPHFRAVELNKKLRAPIYAFYEAKPELKLGPKGLYQFFQCRRTHCSHTVNRNIHGSDHMATGNLRHHAMKCWTDDCVRNICNAATNVDDARKELQGRTAKIDMFFPQISPGRGAISPTMLTARQNR